MLAVPASAAPTAPKLPYYDWGACTFECCSYRAWRTTAPVTALAAPSTDAPVLFHVAKNLPVTGVTGVVITSRYGVTRITQKLRLGFDAKGKGPLLPLKKGDVVYSLHDVGEGNEAFWYDGKIYSDQIYVPPEAWGNTPHQGFLETLARTKYQWWVKIKTAQGRTGWTSQTGNFSTLDRCA